MGAPYHSVSRATSSCNSFHFHDPAHHEITSRPPSNRHAHSNSHPRTPKHIPHNRRHCGEEPPVRGPIDNHEQHQGPQRRGGGPYGQHTHGGKRHYEEERVESAKAVAKDPAADAACGGSEVEACEEGSARAGGEGELAGVEGEEEGGHEEGEGADCAGEEDCVEGEGLEEAPFAVALARALKIVV